MAYEHASGLPNAYDRADVFPDAQEVVFAESAIVQGANFNELQSVARRRSNRVANLTVKDGDRIDGCDIILDPTNTRVLLAAGHVYVAGDVRPVSAATLNGIAQTGDVRIGVRLVRTLITSDDDPRLLGLQPGTAAETEPGASMVLERVAWAVEGDSQPGDFFAVYLLRNGVVIDQTPPTILSGVNAAIAAYDRDAHRNYIVEGCEVTALGRAGTYQLFSIQAGVANIMGYKRSRQSALRVVQQEDPDLELIAAEPHTLTAATGAVVAVNQPPIAVVESAVVVKEVTQTGVVRGTTAGGTDALAHASVVAIVSVVQGGTTFVAGTDYVLQGDGVSWSPTGAEPVASSTYTVTYRYNAQVVPDAITDTAVTLSGGVVGTTALITYRSKIPRVDLLCLDQDGNAVYVKGISARFNALAPLAPTMLLKLAEVANDWYNLPAITNNGTHAMPYDELAALKRLVLKMADQFDRQVLVSDVRWSASSADGIFTDTFADDTYRDQGAPQTAAVVGGSLQLAVDLVGVTRLGTGFVTLEYTDEVVLSQDQATSSMRVNPFANLVRLPAGLKIEPATDFWTEQQAQWTSPVTQEFAIPSELPDGSVLGTTTVNEVVSERSEVATTLRRISIGYTISGFGVGEILSRLTFDGIDVRPAGTTVGDANGRITGTFTVPANVPTGRRIVRAEGAAGSYAEAVFVGEGSIEIDVMRQVTLTQRAAPMPVQIVQVQQPIYNTVVEQPIIQQTIVQQTVNPVTLVTQTIVQQTVIDPGPPATPTGVAGFITPGGHDPLAQTVTLPEPRQITGVDFVVRRIGDPAHGIRVQICEVEAGIPTTPIAEFFLSMQGVAVGARIGGNFDVPVFRSADREHAIVWMTDDPDHEIAIAQIGDLDTATQTFVASQAYTAGTLLASSNHMTWTPVQNADATFRERAAKYTATSRTVVLGTVALVQVSDLIVRGTVELPSAATTFRYEVVRADGSVIKAAPGQVIQFDDYVSETVTIRAVLTGTAKLSPVLYPGTLVVAGKIRQTGDYVTRLFPMGSNVTARALFAARLPSGAAVSVSIDKGDGNWVAMTAGGARVLGQGWTEPTFQKTAWTTAQGRLRLQLSGGPAARLALARLRAYSA